MDIVFCREDSGAVLMKKGEMRCAQLCYNLRHTPADHSPTAIWEGHCLSVGRCLLLGHLMSPNKLHRGSLPGGSPREGGGTTPWSSLQKGGGKGSLSVRRALFSYFLILEVFVHFQVTSSGSLALMGSQILYHLVQCFSQVQKWHKESENQDTKQQSRRRVQASKINSCTAPRAEPCKYSWEWFINSNMIQKCQVSFLWIFPDNIYCPCFKTLKESSGSIFEEIHIHTYPHIISYNKEALTEESPKKNDEKNTF